VLLVLFNRGAFTWPVTVACLLIVVGAALAKKDMLRRR